MQRSNSGLFWPVLVLVTTVDFCTKALAVNRLTLEHMPHDLFGDWMRFTLVYNPGAAFGLHVGEHSRWIFMVLTMIALVILGRLYMTTRSGDVMRTLSLALVCGGAVGNLIDRGRFGAVVDFVDVHWRGWHWPAFNVADSAISVGVVLLALRLLGDRAATPSG